MIDPATLAAAIRLEAEAHAAGFGHADEHDWIAGREMVSRANVRCGYGINEYLAPFIAQALALSTLEIARLAFTSHTTALIEQDHGRGPMVRNEQFGYHHGWIRVGDESFDRARCFPQQHDLRFPADQGLSD